MKGSTLPPLRVSEELRREVESLLQEGETVSSFVMDAVSRSLESRRARQQFLERGLASAQRARETGQYIPAEKVVERLAAKLTKAGLSGEDA